MSKKVILVGHCGPDSSYLRMAVQRADRSAVIKAVDDPRELEHALQGGAALVLLNRELGYGFNDLMGVDLVRELHTKHPNLKVMLVTNYPDVQAEAIANGALPGFGKRELGTPRVSQLLAEAIGQEQTV